MGENIREKLLDIDLSNDCLDMTPELQATEVEINKWGYLKLKNICTAKEINDQRMKRQPREWE